MEQRKTRFKPVIQYGIGTKDNRSGGTKTLGDKKLENIKNLCRICLSHSKNMTPLLSDNQDMLANMFTSITSIQICPTDGLPTKVCNKCGPQVKKCYQFKLKCEESDLALKALVKNKCHIKSEPMEFETDIDLIEDTKITLSEIKDEIHNEEDAEYLESLSNSDRESETVCYVQDISEGKEKKYDITIADSMKLAQKIILEVKPSKKKKRLYMCPICFKNFPKAKSLYAHVKEYHPPVANKHPCAKCKESFATEHDLKLHSILHAKGNKCTQCEKDFKSNTMLRRHIQRHMETKRYSCGACSKAFTELYALRRHVRVHTGETIEKKLSCHICGKRYSDGTQLATHIARHTGDRPCVCATCGKKFASKRLLKSHQMTHSDNKPYPCSFCDRRFRHESTRNTHHRTHTGEKPYVCSFCGKTFIQHSNLSLHLRTHTGERPYKCDLCDRKFSSGSSLAAHNRIHTGEKPYSCPICGKRFARMGMTVHMRQHSGERPHACHVCPKQFATAARLRQHCRIHTGEKPFECASCDQKFTAKAHLTKHIKSHRRPKNKGTVVVQRIDPNVPISIPSNYIITETTNDDTDIHLDEEIVNKSTINESNIVVNVEDVPIEVGQELILPSENETETNILVVDNSENNQNTDICLSTNGVNYIKNDPNTGEVNLVTVNEGEVSISASSAMLEGATVKLYQVDQSLVQIHSVGGQVTISKIISKMTANF